MRVSTDWSEQTPDELAYAVKCEIEGKARGATPTFRRMRLPPLYESGIVFRLEPDHGSGFEEFAAPWVTLDRGFGDCDDLVIYRLAELYARNKRATCSCTWDGDSMHVQVRHANGQLEDPAVLLGAGAWQQPASLFW